MENRGPGIQSDGAADQLDSPRMVALLVMEHPEQMQRVAVFGLACQDRAIQVGRRIEVACLVDRQGVRQVL